MKNYILLLFFSLLLFNCCYSLTEKELNAINILSIEWNLGWDLDDTTCNVERTGVLCDESGHVINLYG